jgi:hypothetical protein
VSPRDNSPTSPSEDPTSRLPLGSGSNDSPFSASSDSSSSHEKSNPTETDSGRPTLKVDFAQPKPLKSMTPVDPCDHSQLHMAWEAMLQKHFLVPRFTTVGQLYFGSVFTVKVHPRLEVPLPPNSSARHHTAGATPSETPGHANTDTPSSVQTTSAQLSHDYRSRVDTQGSIPVSWAAMHLARSVCTVIGCKENMWKAYRELFGEPLSTPSVIHSFRGKPIKNDPSAAVRDEFETAWSNWER